MRTHFDPETIIEAAKDVRNRQTKAAGFEGLALDDALVYTNAYKDMSFFPLTQAIVSDLPELRGLRP